MAQEKAKVTVTLDVKMTLEVSNDGYLGITDTVGKHIQMARDEARAWQYLVKKGSLEPEPIQAKVTVLAVSIIPES